MKTVVVFGASDDLVEVEGGGLDDEWGSYDAPQYLEFSNGTKVKAEYSPDGYHGKWKVELLANGENCTASHVPAPDDDDDYSDRLTLTGPFEWVECWDDEEPDREQIEAKVSQMLDDASDEQIATIYRVLRGQVKATA